MGFRTVVISRRAKLDYKLDYLVVRTEDKISRIHLSEISVLLIESTAVSLTTYLLAELARQKIKVIFCDGEHNPYGELCPYYGSHDTSRKFRQQLQWAEDTKGFVWAEIVRGKLMNQIASICLRSSPVTRQTERRMLRRFILMLYLVRNRFGSLTGIYVRFSDFLTKCDLFV